MTSILNLVSGRFLEDGYYDVTDMEYIDLGVDHLRRTATKEAEEFVERHSDKEVWAVSAYETYTVMLFAGKPRKINILAAGKPVGHGACTVLDNCPKSILLVAEND
jgi:hypothetical protein